MRYLRSAANPRNLLFLFWLAIVFLTVGYLSVIHNSPIPGPNENGLSSQPPSGWWREEHFLAAGCPCSSYLAEYLVRRHPSVGIDEGVVCIGHHAAYLPDLKRAGWKVSELTEKEAEAQYHLAGAPWLVIYDPKGRVRYSGGYLGRMIHSAQDGFLDQAILASLQRGETVTRLGAFGCLTRRSEQRDLDPVGLKYQQARSED